MVDLTGTITEQVTVTQPTRITGVVRAGVAIIAPVEVTLTGRIQGTGSVSSGARLRICGAHEGTLTVARGAEVIVEPGGKLAGTLNSDGLVIVRGVFGGAQNGDGELRLEENGYIKQPDEVRGDVRIYRW